MSSERAYERSVKYVSSAVWAIHPETLAIIREIVSMRSNGERLTKEQIAERIGTKAPAAEPSATETPDPVAVINITGAIVPHADMFSEISGAASVEALQEQLRAAVASEDVKTIVLNIDSPGGDVSLVPEFADEIRAARKTKHVVAVANTFAASAAYWIAAQADELVVSPSGQVGSIGVYTMHEDISGMMEKTGVETTIVSAGKYKTEKNPFGPLSDVAKANMQEKIDAYYGMFLSAVAKGRGTTTNTVRDGFGEGRMVLAADAVENGMADSVATFDQTLERLRNEADSPPAPKRSADDLSRVRATSPEQTTYRDANGGPPTLTGYGAVFDSWTEIDSMVEGHFMERFASGAFTKTLRENQHRIRVLFNHGRDPQIGDKVLGPLTALEEDAKGLRYEAALLDTDYNRELIPGLRAGVYGSSIRFSVMRVERDPHPGVSQHNPKGIPERTVREARLMELGPVTFEAYPETSAGVRSVTRSLTDDFTFGRFAPGADAQAERALTTKDTAVFSPLPADDPSTTVEDEPPHSPPDGASRDTPPDTDRRAETTDESEEHVMNDSIEEMRARQESIKQELQEIAVENRGSVLSANDQARWDQLDGEHKTLDANCEAEEARQARLAELSVKPEHREAGAPPARDTGTFVTARAGRDKTPENVFDMTAYHGLARDQGHMMRLMSDGARRAIESFDYPHPEAKREDVNSHVEQLLQRDSGDKEIAQRVLLFGSPAYRSAFGKTMMKQALTREEQAVWAAGAQFEAQRALSTGDTGGVTVPIQIDPTVIPTSNGVLNPIRQISRVVSTTSYIWQGVTSAGVTMTYRAEGTHMVDGSPTLVAKPIQPERYDCFIPFSWEAGQDWTALESSLGELIQDAKDQVEATKFAVGAGHGSNEPQGVLVGAGTVVGSSAATAFGSTDIYALEAALPPRYQPNASWVATPTMFQRVRQFATAAGPGAWADNLVVGNPPTILGYPAYKASTVGTAGNALTSTARWGVFGDFSRYVIVDRIGMTVRLIPDLFGGTAAVHYPTGQSGLVAYGRNSAGVVDSNAFRVGTIT